MQILTPWMKKRQIQNPFAFPLHFPIDLQNIQDTTFEILTLFFLLYSYPLFTKHKKFMIKFKPLNAISPMQSQ